MSLSDSMFLFEVVVEELKSFVDCKEFYIRSQFADVFTLNLKDPNELVSVLSKKKKLKKKKVRNAQTTIKKDLPEAKVQSGQSILFASNIETLILNMKRFQIELSLWDKDETTNRVGCTHIPWSPVYIEYLNKILIKQNPAPAFVSGGYNVFDENTSKRMATIRLNIKLTYLKDKITSSFRSLSEENQKTFMYTGFNSKATTILSTVKDKPINLMEETGIIKTIYSNGRRKFKPSNKIKSKNTEKSNIADSSMDLKDHKFYKDAQSLALQDKTQTDTRIYEEPEQVESIIHFLDSPVEKYNVNQSIVSLVKSNTDFDRNKQIEVIKTKSCASVNQEYYKILNYIFGDSKGPYGNQVYCVGYFTVENDNAKSPASSRPGSSKASAKESSEKSDDSPKGRYKFRVCDSECPVKIGEDGPSECSLDLPEEAADLITVTKCKQVDCEGKKHKELPEPPDERILLDLKNLTQECCEEVIGGMTAKMKFKEDNCFCSCECTFGFVKKTTYCGICGGFEKPGEDFSQKQPNVPFPCPIYHKLVDKNKLKSLSASGSDTKKRLDDSQRNLKSGAKSVDSAKSDKNAESDKDSKKGKKKKKDDRFKFNYGYAAPQIGHSQCTMPCTGTLGAVPKSMGWLWTAENVPGIKAGWRPGAVSKRLLKKLNKAKNKSQSVNIRSVPITTLKKQSPAKPTLTVSKQNGEYKVEMQVENVNKKIACNPLVYKITAPDTAEKVKAKARKERRLIRKKLGAVWSDPYNPNACIETCYKAYKQAIGFDPFDPCNPECVCPEYHDWADSCSCSDDSNVDSEASSLDVDWEIQFTPPSAIKKN